MKCFHSSPALESHAEIPTTVIPNEDGIKTGSTPTSGARSHMFNLSIDPLASPVVPPSSRDSVSPILGPALAPSHLLESQTPDGRSSERFSGRSWSTSGVSPKRVPKLQSRVRPASTIFGSSNNNSNQDSNEDGDSEVGPTVNGVPLHTPYQSLLPTTPQYVSQTITCETMMELLRGSPTVGNNPNAAYAHLYDRVIIVDCRFPYEYNGGHIKSSINLFKEQMVFEHFLRDPPPSMEVGRRTCIVFHCEFSQERGPHLFKRLRGRDRDIHGLKAEWSKLFYPEMYVMSGGYKEFYCMYGNTANSISSTPTPCARALTPLHHIIPQPSPFGDHTLSPNSVTRSVSSAPRFRSIGSVSSPASSSQSMSTSNLWPHSSGLPSPALIGSNELSNCSAMDLSVSSDGGASELSFFEPEGSGYVRMRDSRYAKECAALLNDHKREKKLPRSQSTGELSLAVGVDPPPSHPSSNAQSSSNPTVTPSTAPSPAMSGRILSPRFDSSASASSSHHPVDNHLHDMRTIRRRSLSSFARMPLGGGGGGGGAGGDSSDLPPHHTHSPSVGIFSPLPPSIRSPLERSYSAADSPLSNSYMMATPQSRSAMTPSPSPLLMNFSLSSPSTSSQRHSTSFNNSVASPNVPSLNAALIAAATSSPSVGPHAAVLPPSPPQLIHSRSDFTSTVTFKRQSGGSIRSNCNHSNGSSTSWGIDLTFPSASLSAALIAASFGTSLPSPSPTPAHASNLPLVPHLNSPSDDEDEDDLSVSPPLPPSTASSRSQSFAAMEHLVAEESDEDM